MLKLCGETEEKLAQELLQFEVQIERDVVEPLYVLAEVSVLSWCIKYNSLDIKWHTTMCRFGSFFWKLSLEYAKTVLQVDIPNIQKQRKHLAKLVLDMDSARTRWRNIIKEIHWNILCKSMKT